MPTPKPPSESRHHRLTHRAAPLAVLAVVALAFGMVAGSGPSEAEQAGARYARAWERGDYAAMHRLLTPGARRSTPVDRFAAAYRDAAATATATGLRTGEPDESGGLVRVPAAVRTRVFATIEADAALPAEPEGIAWEPHLVFPGLRPGERLRRDSTTPPRAKILARGGRVITEGRAGDRSSPLGPAGDEIAGRVGAPATEPERRALYARGFSRDGEVGVTGLERALELQVAGRPGGRLVAGSRTLATARPRPAAPVRTTIDPEVQEAAVTGLAGRFGGVAALDARTGEVRALAGIAFSAPQPPGSVFKIVTATAALEAGLVRASTKFPRETRAVIEGVDLENANGESCGGTFVQSFAHSCNSVFAPLGVRVGARRLVEAARRYGFNARPEIAGAVPSTIPAAGEIGGDLALGSTAIGQGRVLATPLTMASVAQTVASGGVRRPPRLVAGGPALAEVRASSPATARTVERMMRAVVRYGTGTLAAVPGLSVAGKTGTAELGRTQGEDVEAAPDPTDTDAWFTAYAPADRPRLAVAVLLVRNGAGGDTAAPVARTVLATAARR